MKSDPENLRRIARAARASGKDDDDPVVREALDALEHFPEIMASLEAERRQDLEIIGEYRDADPPAGLESRLIAALREARKGAAAPDEKIVRATFSRRAWIGSAAAALAVSTGAVWWRSRLLPLDRLVERLVEKSRGGVTLSLMSMETDKVVNWLRENNAPRAQSLPVALDALGRKGCHIYEIEGRRVSLECFLLPGMRELHLFTTPSSGLSGEPAIRDGIVFRSEGKQTAALWSQGEQTMVLISEVGKDELGPVLGA
jgi:hypothetical protein